MLVPLLTLKDLIIKARQVFVLVRLSREVSVYLGITKTTILEYLEVHMSQVTNDSNMLINAEFNENSELLIGYSLDN